MLARKSVQKKGGKSNGLHNIKYTFIEKLFISILFLLPQYLQCFCMKNSKGKYLLARGADSVHKQTQQFLFVVKTWQQHTFIKQIATSNTAITLQQHFSRQEAMVQYMSWIKHWMTTLLSDNPFPTPLLRITSVSSGLLHEKFTRSIFLLSYFMEAISPSNSFPSETSIKSMKTATLF